MTTEHGDPETPKSDNAKKAERTFLVVVDETEEMRAALRYACKRARRTDGMVALLHVVSPPGFQQFAAIRRLMGQESRQMAEETIQSLAADVNACSGHVPLLFIREGDPAEELVSLIEEEPGISVLVLAAGTGPGGPGPLVSALSGKLSGRIRIPVTIVPGSLTDAQIDLLT